MENNTDIIDEMLERGAMLRYKKVVMVLAPEAYVRLCSHGVSEEEITECREQAQKAISDMGNPHLIQIVMHEGTIDSVQGRGGRF